MEKVIIPNETFVKKKKIINLIFSQTLIIFTNVPIPLSAYNVIDVNRPFISLTLNLGSYNKLSNNLYLCKKCRLKFFAAETESDWFFYIIIIYLQLSYG
jgi:hypothetical protein